MQKTMTVSRTMDKEITEFESIEITETSTPNSCAANNDVAVVPCDENDKVNAAAGLQKRRGAHVTIATTIITLVSAIGIIIAVLALSTSLILRKASRGGLRSTGSRDQIIEFAPPISNDDSTDTLVAGSHNQANTRPEVFEDAELLEGTLADKIAGENDRGYPILESPRDNSTHHEDHGDVTASFLLPEDCDNNNCKYNNLIGNSTSLFYEKIQHEQHDKEEQEATTFHGPLSDFIELTNMTRAADNKYNKECKSNQGKVLFNLLTDSYPWEISWSIVKTSNSKTFASGPPAFRNYERRTRYIGSFCLPSGQYNLIMNDKMGDGICCSQLTGHGQVSISVNGQKVVQSKTTGNGDSYRVKRYPFMVTRSSSAAQPDVVENNLEVVTFRRGDLGVTIPELGIKVCTGMSVRVIARANQKILLADGTYSKLKFHSMPDGAAIFPYSSGGGNINDDGKYIYVSNSEMQQGLGGVYGMVFDGATGNVLEYKQLLSGTTRNCGGGVSPWKTWLTCEEYGIGQCWQVGKSQV